MFCLLGCCVILELLCLLVETIRANFSANFYQKKILTFILDSESSILTVYTIVFTLSIVTHYSQFLKYRLVSWQNKTTTGPLLRAPARAGALNLSRDLGVLKKFSGISVNSYFMEDD